ncbi:MAG: SusF/SusE family outer membrane protein [Cytophagales bacterium]|nr:SusF/SusE family outer membrane protein [Cytophagales bacterium]
MMKKYFNFLMVCASFLALTVFVSCSEDDPAPIIDEEEPIPVPDGMYLVGSATSTSPVSDFTMGPGVVGGPDFTTLDRTGMFTTFVFLGEGTFQFIEYINGDSTIWGGEITVAPMAEGSNYNMGTGTAAEDGAAISPLEANTLHHVVIDKQSGTIYLSPVKQWEIIGPAQELGWNEGTQIALGSSDATGTTFSTEGIVLRGPNEYKYRYNSNWDLAFDDIEDFNIFTNFGLTDGGLLLGGSNFNFEGDDGVYTVSASFSPTDISFNQERTGDVEELTYDPLDFPWGIIGAGTETGWDADTDLTYLDWANTWTGIFYLTADVFKFRNDDAWSAELNPGNVNLTSETVTDNGDGNFVTATEGLYFVRVSAVEGEEGTTWNLEVDIVNPGLIGEATENGWDGPDIDIPAVTTSGTDLSWKIEQYSFNAGGWKIRIGDGWEIGFGFPDVTIDGTNAALITDADGNFNLAEAGSHDVTFSTSDNGATWTLTFD